MVLDNDIIKALRKYRGIVASTAKEVGMTRSSLSRHIHRTKHLEEEIRETAEDAAGFCCRTGSGYDVSITMPSRSRREYICPNSALPSSSQ